MSELSASKTLRRFMTVAALSALAAGAFGSAADAKSELGCKGGTRYVDGLPVQTFCGPARATVRVGASTLRFAGGRCERGDKYLSVRIGTIGLADLKPRPDYFGLSVGTVPLFGGPAARVDGTYRALGLVWVHDGTDGSLPRAAVTLQAGRSRGVFTGTIRGRTVRGSFAC